MRRRLAIAVLAGMLLACAAPLRPAAADGSAPVPVIVELYTSEGCSDCPPADRVLTDLETGQPVPGVEVIALGEHVDYWNYLGWTDRFSSAALTRRQKDYQATVFAPTPVYTPQLVIDGRLQCIGSDLSDVRRQIRRAAEAAKADVRLAATRPRAGGTSVSVDVVLPDGVTLDGPADILVAVVEDGLVTEVPRGENRGRTLEHNAVVRHLEAVGDVPARKSTVSVTAPVAVAEGWNPERLSIVAFVQERDSRRIVGAASIEVPD